MIWYWFVGGYLILGLTMVILSVLSEWFQGEDLTLAEVPLALLVIFIWPIFLPGMLLEWIEKQNKKKPFSQRVILKGRMSAKVAKALYKE